MTDRDFKGRVTVVTGAASGIGRSITLHALGKGMHVFAADVSAEGLAQLKADVVLTDGELHCRRVDVSNEAEMTRFSESVFDQVGRVNLLFNNAGIMATGRSWEMPLSIWRRSFEVNVVGVVNGIRAFLPKMLAQGCEGRILNTSSVGGLLGGGEFMGAYQGTKHMVSALTESLERELRAEGARIRVSLICPGAVNTSIGRYDNADSEQNSDKRSAELGFREQFVRLIADGTHPDELTEEIFEGIRQNRFWIIPKSIAPSRLQRRGERIIAELGD